LFAQTTLWALCFSATGQVRRIVGQSIAWAAVNLPASLLLTHFLGIVGPLLGTTVSYLTVSAWYLPRALQQTFGTSAVALAKAAVLPALWGTFYAAVLWWLARRHQPYGWLGLAVEMSLAALLSLAVSARWFLTPEERTLWLARLRGLRPSAPVS
jgi:hypothetical protein